MDEWDRQVVASPDNVVDVGGSKLRAYGAVVLNKEDPAVSMLRQCELMPGYLLCDDEPTRRVEVMRLRLFCTALLELWEQPNSPVLR